MSKGKGKVVSGWYESSAGDKKVMTKRAFKRKMNLRGSKSGSKPTHWHKLRQSGS